MGGAEKEKDLSEREAGAEVHLTFRALSKGAASSLSSCSSCLCLLTLCAEWRREERPRGIFLLWSSCQQPPHILTRVPGRRRVWGLRVEQKERQTWTLRRMVGCAPTREGLPLPLNRPRHLATQPLPNLLELTSRSLLLVRDTA